MSVIWRVQPNGESARIQLANQAGPQDLLVVPDVRSAAVYAWVQGSAWMLVGVYRHPRDLGSLIRDPLLRDRPLVQLAVVSQILEAWFKMQRDCEAVTEPLPPDWAKFWAPTRYLPAGPAGSARPGEGEARLAFYRWLYERGRLSEWPEPAAVGAVS